MSSPVDRMSYRSPKRYNLLETNTSPLNYDLKTPPVHKSPGFQTSPLIQSLQPLVEKSSISFHKFQKQVSIKDVFQRKQNLTLDELYQDKGYRVYYLIFRKILWLLMLLGLWAPEGGGWGYWCLRTIYPKFIYFVILYPWTTFLTQEAYWSIPVFLFINLHLSGIFAYRSARMYWKENHLVKFLTSTFIPFYDELFEFERRRKRLPEDDDIISNMDDDNISVSSSVQTTLQYGFQQRYKSENRRRRRIAKKRYQQYEPINMSNKRKKSRNDDNADDALQLSLHESLKKIRKDGSDPFRQKEENITSWATIAGSENKLSLSLFYEATQRMWWRFWSWTALIALPIIAILLVELISPDLQSSISTRTNKAIKLSFFRDIFIPFNTTVTFLRIFYNICEFVFMAFYFQFICECHRGDLNIHFHYYDTSDIDEKQKQSNISVYNSILQYYQDLEFRLASIVWDWDRIVSSARDTSKAFRWWLFVMVIFNFMAGVTAAINLTTHDLDSKHPKYPQHLEMYLPAVINLIISFFVLLTGAKVSHMNRIVRRRTYFLLASTHFSHIQVTSHHHEDINNSNSNINNAEANVVINIEDINDINYNDNNCNQDNDDDDDEDDDSKDSTDGDEYAGTDTKGNPLYIDLNGLEVKKQNLYIQAQTVANATTTRQIGISVYGLILDRRLFLAFFSPFVAFSLFCINTWLPK